MIPGLEELREIESSPPPSPHSPDERCLFFGEVQAVEAVRPFVVESAFSGEFRYFALLIGAPWRGRRNATIEPEVARRMGIHEPAAESNPPPGRLSRSTTRPLRSSNGRPRPVLQQAPAFNPSLPGGA